MRASSHAYGAAQRHEFRITLDVGHKVEHVDGRVLDAAACRKVRHQRRSVAVMGPPPPPLFATLGWEGGRDSPVRLATAQNPRPRGGRNASTATPIPSENPSH